jgi:chromosome segregation ATPase
MPVTTAEAGQVIATDTNNELPHGTGQAAAKQSAPVTTELSEIRARAIARASQAEQLAAWRAAAAEAKAKAAAEAEALAKAAEEAKLAAEDEAKQAAEAAEAKAKEEKAKAKAAEEAKAKVDQLEATILDLSSQCGNAAHATETCERDLADSKRQLNELSGSIESARENGRITSAAAASSRQKHAESIAEHAAAVSAASALSDEFDSLFSNFDATSLSVTIEDKKVELAEMDADAGEEAKCLKAEIALLESTLVDGNALHSMLTSKKADVSVK